MNGKWGTIAQWIAITLTFIGMLVTITYKFSNIETEIKHFRESQKEEFKGYSVLFSTARDELKEIDKRHMERFKVIEDRQYQILQKLPNNSRR